MSKSYTTRKGAAEYLTNKGLKITAQTLARIAATSAGGPIYSLWGMTNVSPLPSTSLTVTLGC
jgi:hypothetical protein